MRVEHQLRGSCLSFLTLEMSSWLIGSADVRNQKRCMREDRKR